MRGWSGLHLLRRRSLEDRPFLVHRLNYVDDFGNITNYVRTYVVDGERGHLVLSYPNGLPEHPMPYWCESWTGLEYVFAMGCAQAGELRLAEDASSP